jgi:hypothetical protein
MQFRTPTVPSLVFACLGTLSLCGVSVASSQNSGGGFELHANGNITASDVGLPVYPGSKLFKSADNDSTVDMGFTLGDTHFKLVAANYLSGDSPGKILDFYRKPLARYGDVLECDHGKPVGAIKSTRSGLTCNEQQHGQQDGHVQVEGDVDSSNDHELRAGTPQKIHIVGIGERQGSANHFGLVYIELPKDSGSATKKD